MKSANLRSLLPVLLAAAAGLTSCKKPMTYVHVKILPAAAGEPAAISDVQLDLDLAGKKTSIHLTDGASPITFPTDVTLEVKTGSGQLAIVAICKNASGAEVDRATGTVTVNSGAIAEAALQLPGGKPDLVPTEPQHDFSSVTAGQTGAAINISFTNVGFVQSGQLSVVLGGVGAAQFGITADTCVGRLAPGASCLATVVFQPVISGPIAATLTVSATPGGSAVVALTGTGQPNPQSVAVGVSGNGRGSIASSPAGLVCSTGTCTHAFDYGASVALTPTPATGSHFGGWTGACSGTGACIVTATQARTVGASFVLDSEQLSVVVTGDGTVTSADTSINCTATFGTCSASFNYGSVVTLNAASGAGSHLASWSEPACGNVTPCTLPALTAPRSVTATFAPNIHNVTVALSGSGNGTLTSTDTVPGLSCSWTAGASSPQTGACTTQVAFGSTFTVDATPDATTSFVGGGSITGAASSCSTIGNTNSCVVTVGDADIQLASTFTHNPEEFDVTINGTGTGSVSDAANGFSCASGTCPDFVPYGSASVTFTATPGASSVVNWSGCTPSGNTCTVNGPIVSGPNSVTATFTKVLQVSVAGGGNGSGTVTSDVGGINCTITNGAASGVCSATVNSGSNMTLSAALATGTASMVWSGGCTPSGLNCTLTNITTAPAVSTATFTLQKFAVAINGTSGPAAGSGTVTGGGLSCTIANGATSGTCSTFVNYGSGITLTAAPSSGSAFLGFSGGCANSGTTCTLSNVTSAPAATVASFTKTFPVAVGGTGSVSGAGSGTVTGGGLNCTIANGVSSGTCTVNANYGSNLTLTATPSGTDAFVSWSGGCAGSASTCTLTNITAAPATTVATFTKTFVVSVAGGGSGAGAGSGTVTLFGQTCTITNGVASGTCSATVNYGAGVTFTEAASGTDAFVSWAGGCTGSTGSCTIPSVTAASTTTATFTKTFPVVINSAPTASAGSGVITGGQLNCTINFGVTSGTCSTPVNYGSSIVLNQSPASGSAFVSWAGGCSGSGATCTISNVTSTPAATTATFIRTFTVAVSGAGSTASAGSGTITGGGLNCSIAAGISSGVCSTTVTYGSNLVLSETPLSGSGFVSWSGGCAGAGSTCTLTNITSTPANTVATFTKTFVVAVSGAGSSAGAGSGTVTLFGQTCTITSGVASGTCSATVNYGGAITFTEAPAGIDTFGNWSGGCVGTTGSCTISNITATPATTVAAFNKNFTLTVSVAGTGNGNVTSTPAGINCGNGGAACSAPFQFNTIVSLSPTPAVNNVASGWSGVCTQSGGKCAALVNANVSATGYFTPTTSFCSSGNPAQIFTGGVMQGCAGSVSYAARASRCAPGCRVASADEYVAFRNAVTPTHNYWTDDNLKYSSGAGVCGANCGSSSCFAGNGSTYTSACANPMHVCAATQPDPETNTCTWTNCGYNSTTPSVGFGGCSGSNDGLAGAVCICGVQSWFVDQAGGSDASEGTSAAPFATITHALGVAAGGQVVHVKPGSYSAGEAFPMNIPPGVSLIGDEAGRGATTTILGTVQPGAGATVAGFTINSTLDGVDANADRITIRNDTLTGNSYPIKGASTNLAVLLNLVTNNSNQMLFTSGSTASGKIENNTITRNAYGIELDSAGPDMGGGGSSVGNNIFSCNANADIWVNSGLAITAANNRWDHGPPTNNGSTWQNTGIDLYTTVAANITSANTGASQAPNPCACDTTATSAQLFDGAMVGCGGPGVPASIAYTSRSSLCPLGTHACTGAEWNAHRGAIPPNTNYWTGDNPLKFVGGSPTACSVSATAGTNPCGGGAMLVCPNSGGQCQASALACGLDTNTPQFFGGCSSAPGGFGVAQGTLCCNP